MFRTLALAAVLIAPVASAKAPKKEVQKVTKKGTDPQRLRIEPSIPGSSTGRYEMTTDVTVYVAGQVQDTPPVPLYMDMDFTYTQGENGLFKRETQLVDVGLVGEWPAEVQEVLAEEIGDLSQLSYVEHLDDRGAVKHTFYPNDAAEAYFNESSSSTTALVLPDKPIGVGGSWTDVRRVSNNGLVFWARYTYDLVDRTDDSVHLVWTATFENGDEEEPMRRGQVTMVPKEISGSATGDVTLNLRTGFPSGTSNVALKMVMEVQNPAGGPLEMTSEIDLDLKMIE